MLKYTKHVDEVRGYASAPASPIGSAHGGTSGYADGCPICVQTILKEREDTPEAGQEIPWQDDNEALAESDSSEVTA